MALIALLPLEHSERKWTLLPLFRRNALNKLEFPLWKAREMLSCAACAVLAVAAAMTMTKRPNLILNARTSLQFKNSEHQVIQVQTSLFELELVEESLNRQKQMALQSRKLVTKV